MSTEELTEYQYKLDQVNLALRSEPENASLLKLKADLTELIKLLDQEVTISPKKSPSSISPRTNSTPTTPISSTMPTFTKPLQVGDSCLARWSGDGQFYQAEITAIGGGDQVFSVIFKGVTLILAGGGAYYFAKKDIDARRRAQNLAKIRPEEKLEWWEKIERDSKKDGSTSTSNSTNVNNPKTNGNTSSTPKTSVGDKT
ncbi:9094_t:CDS:2 [Entrophospora sp. SA101]|nr:9094_t:CDS:2 [Entrophospora sp. SA101]